MYDRSRRQKIHLNYNEKRIYIRHKPHFKKSRCPDSQPTERIAFPKAIREQIWERDCLIVKGYKTLTAVCPICSSETERKNCHLAHKVSLFNGGGNEQSNLFYICNQCNQSMGTMNAKDYKNMYY